MWTMYVIVFLGAFSALTNAECVCDGAECVLNSDTTFAECMSAPKFAPRFVELIRDITPLKLTATEAVDFAGITLVFERIDVVIQQSFSAAKIILNHAVLTVEATGTLTVNGNIDVETSSIQCLGVAHVEQLTSTYEFHSFINVDGNGVLHHHGATIDGFNKVFRSGTQLGTDGTVIFYDTASFDGAYTQKFVEFHKNVVDVPDAFGSSLSVEILGSVRFVGEDNDLKLNTDYLEVLDHLDFGPAYTSWTVIGSVVAGSANFSNLLELKFAPATEPNSLNLNHYGHVWVTDAVTFSASGETLRVSVAPGGKYRSDLLLMSYASRTGSAELISPVGVGIKLVGSDTELRFQDSTSGAASFLGYSSRFCALAVLLSVLFV